MRSGCRGFESRLGHLIFSSICSVYIDRHIIVDLSDDEQYSIIIIIIIISLSLLSRYKEKNMGETNVGVFKDTLV